MNNPNPFFEELSRVAGGAMGALTGLKAEFETLVRQQAERWFATLDLVPRDEFEAVRDMAAKAREQQEALSARVAALEVRLAKCESTKVVAVKPRAKTSRAKTDTRDGEG